MPPAPVIYIVCSDQHRNGKTLLARVLIDYLLLEDRDPFVFDAGYPEGPLRTFFPGRTALVDFSRVAGQMRVFDTMLGSPGRDYVIDLPAGQLQRFIVAVQELRFTAEAQKLGFALVPLFVVDKERESLESAILLERGITPDLLVPAVNATVGTALPPAYSGVKVVMDRLPDDLLALIAHKRFSFRAFLLGEDETVPDALQPLLTAFLFGVVTGLRNIPPALTLAKLHG